MDKPLLCGKTAKDYKFWDNLMHHYKNLYPLYDKKVDFKQYTRCVNMIESFAAGNIKPYVQISNGH